MICAFKEQLMSYSLDFHPVITVIMPVYNAEKSIRASIESVLSQSIREIQLILVDDGSKDRSLSICREYAGKDQRIMVLSQENGGPAKARNAALPHIKGDYLLFVDSDDRMEPDACKIMLDALGDQDLVIGHFYFEMGKNVKEHGLLNGNRTLNSQQFIQAMIKRPGSFYFSALWNKLYKTSIIQALDIRFQPDLRWGEDFAFNMQYYYAVEGVSVIDDPVYRYVKNAGSSSIRSLIHILDSCRIKWKLYKHLRALCVEKGIYSTHRILLYRHLFNVTIAE